MTDEPPVAVNPWAAGPPAPAAAGGSTSPYGRTGFDVLDLPVEPLLRPEFLTRVRRRANRARAGAAWLDGAPLTQADVQAAAQHLQRPADRIAARLLAHGPHPAHPPVADLSERLAAAPRGATPDGPLLDRSRLAGLLDRERSDER